MGIFSDKEILVTGGCGSIGSEIVKQLVAHNPKRIKVFDQSESGHFHLNRKVQSDRIHNLLGDIRDRNAVYRAMEGVDIVFHAAAIKSVPVCEFNPFEAVRTNVTGTQHLVEAAIDKKVDLFIGISTDKAVNPINTMGATKLLSEKIIINAPVDGSGTRLACVRFGNVLDSVGSVIPLFKHQIETGGPVTVTHPEMTRFFMTIPQAVGAVIEAAKMVEGREVFILKMDALKIMDLANTMVKVMAKDGQDIKVEVIGKRSGEKMNEVLFTEEEAPYISERGDYFVLKNSAFESRSMDTESKHDVYDSSKVHLLNEDEITTLLKDQGVL